MERKQIEARRRFWRRAHWWYVDRVVEKRSADKDAIKDYAMLSRISKLSFRYWLEL